MMEKEKKRFYGFKSTMLVLALALACVMAGATVAAAAPASVFVYGYVKDTAGNPVAGAYVDVFATSAAQGDGTPADIKETQTSGLGYYEVSVRSFDTKKGNCYGSYITVRAYASNHRQSQNAGDGFATVFRSRATSGGGPCSGLLNIKMLDRSGQDNKIHSVGLRESYYGLTRPYFGDGNPSDVSYPWGGDGATAAIVNDWKSRLPAQRPMHVLIVNQTEPTSFKGEEWDIVNGKTYCLWRNYGAPKPDSRLKFLDELQDRNGLPMTFGQVDLDTTLTAYDNLSQDVFIQVEPGHVPMNILIPLVLKRFYKENGIVKHPCVKGLGVDVEWYKNTNPNFDGTTASKAEGSLFLSLVKGFDPKLRLFLKHYFQGDSEAVPPVPPAIDPENFKDIIIVDDSQGFYEDEDLKTPSFQACKDEFNAWAVLYSPADCGFQIGYDTAMFESTTLPWDSRLPRDMRWWGPLPDPVKNVSKGILKALENEPGRQYSFIWVDFSVRVPKINKNVSGQAYPGLTRVTPPPFGPWPNN
jgi:hypothetical protein